MNSLYKYKVSIIVLLWIIILQWIFIFGLLSQIRKSGLVYKNTNEPRVALVIDDLGYNLDNLDILEEIKCPLTVAVLPNLVYSAKIAERLNTAGFEVILHLPMEPQQRHNLERDTLNTYLEKDSIVEIIERDLFSIPYVKGVSNHMGSKATENKALIEILFGQLKKKGLFFLDSMVSAKSVCGQVAKKIGLRFAKRDVFLDNKDDPTYIKGQLEKLKKIARLNGLAVGIGHNRRQTLEVLKENISVMKKEGYRFVFVSDIVR